MEYKLLNNGIKMPVAGFGVYQIHDQKECIEIVKEAIAAGYQLIDTAQSYGNEEAVGIAIRESGVDREKLFITSKVWVTCAGYEKAKKSIEESLKKMQLEYLDLVLIHQPFGDYYGTYRAMEELYKAGKIKAIGVSNFYPDRLVDLCLNVEILPAINQIEVNPFFQQQTALEYNEKYGVQVEAWAPFAEGKNDIFNHPILKTIAQKHHKTTGQVILRWLFQRNIISLAKTVRKERMKENLDIFDFALTDEDMRLIASLDTDTSSFFSHYDPAMVERIHKLH